MHIVCVRASLHEETHEHRFSVWWPP